MGHRGQLSKTLVGDWPRRISVAPLAPTEVSVRTARVQVIGDAAEPAEVSFATAMQKFRKTQSFVRELPHFDESILSFADVGTDRGRDVTYLSDDCDPLQRAELPGLARPDPSLAQDTSELHKAETGEPDQQELARGAGDRDSSCSDDDAVHSTTLRIEPLKPRRASRARRLWQRQSPLIAFCVAASLCILCVLAVMLAP